MISILIIRRTLISNKLFPVILQISQNDGLPDKLCKECTEKAFLSYNFKASIEQSDATLRSVLFKDHSDLKKDSMFDDNNTNYLMGIKTEIAFVDADPFIDDDGDFDASIDYADSSNASNQQNDSYNNNSYSQDAPDDAGDADSEDDPSDENSDMKPPKDKTKKKLHQHLPQRILENVDYIKDEDGKYVCQICNKKLVDKKGLNLHIRLHTGENLKRCNICNRGENLNVLTSSVINCYFF